MMNETGVQFPAFRAARKVLRDLLDMHGVMIPAESLQDYHIHPFVKLNRYFDLDRLWASEDARSSLVAALKPLLAEIDASSPFDTIVPLLSSIGSLGPVPHATILAERLHKRLVISRELDFGRQYLYPGTARSEDLLDGAFALVVTDIVVRASSLRSACSMIREYRGTVSAALVFVAVDTELRPPLPEYLKGVGVPLTVVLLNASELDVVPRL